jgi:iron complex transport system ATP-binding protein
MMELAAVRFSYPAAPDLLRECTLEVGAGEVAAVAGPNGSGKTTLLKLAAGLLAPSEGRVCLDGKELREWGRLERASRLAYAPQTPTVPGDWPVEAVVELGDYPHREGPGAGRSLAARLAWAREAMRLEALWAREARTLSGGETQRVALARVLVQDAPNIVLDEPASHLDLAHQMGLYRLLRELAVGGRSVLLSTHDLNLSRLFGQRLLLMDGSGVLMPWPESREEQGKALEAVFGVTFVSMEVRGVACWFPVEKEPTNQRANEATDGKIQERE